MHKLQESSSKQDCLGVSLTLRKISWVIAKLFFAMALIFVLYRQVLEQLGQEGLWTSLIKNWSLDKSPLLVLSFLLVFCNWSLEAHKWNLLLGPLQLKSSKALKGIFMGQSLGILTPANLGDYGGRQLVLKKAQIKEGLTASFVASIAQNMANILPGLLGGLLLFNLLYTPSLYINGALSSFIIVGSLVLYFLYSHLPSIVAIAWKKLPFDWIRKIEQHLHATLFYTKGQLDQALGLSLLRYAVYVIQYALLLYFFQVEVSFLEALAGISFIYLLQSGLPLPPVLAILARGELAILLWSQFGATALPILSATFTLWVLNKVIPALIGMSLVLGMQSNQEALDTVADR